MMLFYFWLLDFLLLDCRFLLIVSERSQKFSIEFCLVRDAWIIKLVFEELKLHISLHHWSTLLTYLSGAVTEVH